MTAKLCYNQIKLMNIQQDQKLMNISPLKPSKQSSKDARTFKMKDILVLDPKEDFDYFDYLGKGAFASVRACRLRPDAKDHNQIGHKHQVLGDKFYAVKLIPKFKVIRDKFLPHLINEMEFSCLDEPFLLKTIAIGQD